MSGAFHVLLLFFCLFFSIFGDQRGRLVFSVALLHIRVGKCKSFASLFISVCQLMKI